MPVIEPPKSAPRRTCRSTGAAGTAGHNAPACHKSATVRAVCFCLRHGYVTTGHSAAARRRATTHSARNRSTSRAAMQPSGGGRRLAVTGVRHIAGREHAAHAGAGIVGTGCSLFVHGHLAGKGCGVGPVADGNENAGRCQVGHGAVFTFFRRSPVTSLRLTSRTSATTLSQRMSILGCCRTRSAHDPRGAELVAPVNHRHARSEAVRKRRLPWRIAAANHGDGDAPVERAVAGRATRNAPPDQRLFRWQSQINGGRAGGNDDGAARQFRAGIQANAQRLCWKSQPATAPLNTRAPKRSAWAPHLESQFRTVNFPPESQDSFPPRWWWSIGRPAGASIRTGFRLARAV